MELGHRALEAQRRHLGEMLLSHFDVLRRWRCLDLDLRATQDIFKGLDSRVNLVFCHIGLFEVQLSLLLWRLFLAVLINIVIVLIQLLRWTWATLNTSKCAQACVLAHLEFATSEVWA